LPGEIKQAVTGFSKAKKLAVAQQLIGTQRKIVGLPTDIAKRGEDETDAIAIAYCYCNLCLNQVESLKEMAAHEI
jgi:Holliday junction resolvasome RuvABC endonuclease subunit